MSTLDLALTSVLQVLPRRPEFVEEPASMIYSRMASIASRLAVEAAFAERLTSTDAHALGLCSANGVLTEAGSIFAAMTLPEYDRSESRTETIIRARAVINDVTLIWSFSSSETAACFILRCRDDTTGASESAPPNLLLRVDASRPEGIDRAPARVVARAPLLEELDRRFIHSGLDAAALCHVLIGLLPEMLAAEWFEDCYAHVVDSLLRRQRRRNRRAKYGPDADHRPRWWCRHIQKSRRGSWFSR